MSLLTTLPHLYAVAVADLKKVQQIVVSKVLPILEAAKADAPTIEAITALVSPQAANVERVGEALLGTVIAAVEAEESAAGASGLNVSLDAALVADIKAIIPTVKSAVSATAPVKVPLPVSGQAIPAAAQ